MSPLQDEMLIERDLADQDIAVRKDIVPRLYQDHYVGFEMLDVDDSAEKAHGLAVYKIGDKTLYGPLFFIDGRIKGDELLFAKEANLVVPFTESWVEYLIESDPTEIGEASDEALDTEDYDALMDPLDSDSFKTAMEEFLDDSKSSNLKLLTQAIKEADEAGKEGLATFMLGNTKLAEFLINRIPGFMEFIDSPEETNKSSETKKASIKEGVEFHDKVEWWMNDKEKELVLTHGTLVNDNRRKENISKVASEEEEKVSVLEGYGGKTLVKKDGTEVEVAALRGDKFANDLVIDLTSKKAFSANVGVDSVVCKGSNDDWTKVFNKLPSHKYTKDGNCIKVSPDKPRFCEYREDDSYQKSSVKTLSDYGCKSLLTTDGDKQTVAVMRNLGECGNDLILVSDEEELFELDMDEVQLIEEDCPCDIKWKELFDKLPSHTPQIGGSYLVVSPKEPKFDRVMDITNVIKDRKTGVKTLIGTMDKEFIIVPRSDMRDNDISSPSDTPQASGLSSFYGVDKANGISYVPDNWKFISLKDLNTNLLADDEYIGEFIKLPGLLGRFKTMDQYMQDNPPDEDNIILEKTENWKVINLDNMTEEEGDELHGLFDVYQSYDEYTEKTANLGTEKRASIYCIDYDDKSFRTYNKPDTIKALVKECNLSVDDANKIWHDFDDVGRNIYIIKKAQPMPMDPAMMGMDPAMMGGDPMMGMDPAMMGGDPMMGPPPPPAPLPQEVEREIELAMQAMERGDGSFVDTAGLTSLLATTESDAILKKNMGGIISGLDKQGRNLYILYKNWDQYVEGMGVDDLEELVGQLVDAFKSQGDAVLALLNRIENPGEINLLE